MAVRAVRGATQVDADDRDELLAATAELVREVSGRSEEETVSALEELARRGLLFETEGATHAFPHEQARRVAYDLASAGRRRLLHRRAA